MTHDQNEPLVPSAWFWSALAIGALIAAVLIGWLVFVVLS